MLAKIFDFCPADLQANRGRCMSAVQRRKLLRKWLLPILFAGFVLIFCVPLLLLKLSNVSDLNTFATLFGLIAISAALGLIPLWLFVGRIYLDFKKAEIRVVSGKIRMGISTFKRLHYKLWIADMEFEIPKQGFAELNEFQSYQVYYAPLSKLILSMEAIS